MQIISYYKDKLMPILSDQLTSIRQLPYSEVRPTICSGDILLASGSTPFAELIKFATKSIWSHVAFILYVENINRLMVLESVESVGVRTVPLSSYLDDYNGTGSAYPGHLVIARHSEIEQSKIINLSQFAIDLFGYPYATSDIIKIAARISMSALGLTPPPQLATSPRAFICSEYVYECFRSIGLDVCYNPNGYITPEDYARCKYINPICRLAPLANQQELPQLQPL
jgi:hypothetical protein